MTLKSASIIDPVHPGEILAEEFLAPMGLSAAALARKIDAIAPVRLGVVTKSERGYRLDDRDVGRSARLDMRKALELTVESLKNSR